MALAWSVLSVGQGPTSTVHVLFRGSGFSAAAAAGSLLLASLCGGDDDTAGSCLLGAVAAGSAERGGSFSPGAARTGSLAAVFEIAGAVRSLAGTLGRTPFPLAQRATPAEPSSASTTAAATT